MSTFTALDKNVLLLANLFSNVGMLHMPVVVVCPNCFVTASLKVWIILVHKSVTVSFEELVTKAIVLGTEAYRFTTQSHTVWKTAVVFRLSAVS